MPQSESDIQPPMPMHEGTPLEDGDVLSFQLASKELIRTEPEVIAKRTVEPTEEETPPPAQEEEMQPLSDIGKIGVRGQILVGVFRPEKIKEINQQFEQAA